MRKLLTILILTLFLRADDPCDNRKIMYTNIASSAAILAYGYFQWDYSEGSFKSASEGWFGKDTKHGGADKLGHFYVNYVLTHTLAHFLTLAVNQK